MLGVYFSGTGNTRYCVETFVKESSEDVNVMSIEDPKVIDAIKENEFIVFGYPVYYSNLPKIVRDFIDNNKEIFKDKKIYIIATMALFSGDGAGVLARLLKKYGAVIAGGLHLRMPDCIGDVKVLKKSKKNNIKLVKKTAAKIKKAAKDLKNGKPSKEGLNIFYHIAGLLGQRLWFYNATKHYTDKVKIDENKCIKCGKCTKLCPMNNLVLAKGKVESRGKCTMCYRCFSKCPGKAITILGKEVHEQCKVENYLDNNM